MKRLGSQHSVPFGHLRREGKRQEDGGGNHLDGRVTQVLEEYPRQAQPGCHAEQYLGDTDYLKTRL